MKDPISSFWHKKLLIAHPFLPQQYFSSQWDRFALHHASITCARYRPDLLDLREAYPELDHWRDDELLAGR